MKRSFIQDIENKLTIVLDKFSKEKFTYYVHKGTKQEETQNQFMTTEATPNLTFFDEQQKVVRLKVTFGDPRVRLRYLGAERWELRV